VFAFMTSAICPGCWHTSLIFQRSIDGKLIKIEGLGFDFGMVEDATVEFPKGLLVLFFFVFCVLCFLFLCCVFVFFRQHSRWPVSTI
jgi:hypothetical protein